jgi:hypothetical protein
MMYGPPVRLPGHVGAAEGVRDRGNKERAKIDPNNSNIRSIPLDRSQRCWLPAIGDLLHPGRKKAFRSPSIWCSRVSAENPSKCQKGSPGAS